MPSASHTEPERAALKGEGEGLASGSDAPAPAHRPGDVLARKYRLERVLGQGGMGSVWRARSLLLEIDVAVKVVPQDAVSSEMIERLLREARAAASLGHPSIVRVYDFGMTEQGEPFLVMELLEGGSLATLLDERQRLPATTAVRLMLPVVSALASAHARGIVHRDVKPDNIMLVPGEGDRLVPKLVDFGIVKLQGAGATLTDRGTLLGSPAYMSPEQARGLVDVDPRTDIWSACVVLYELITGVRPFDGPNRGAVLYAIFADTPKPSTQYAAGDDALWEILERGLDKTPESRWPDAKALGRELASWAEAQGIMTDATGMSIAEQWQERASSMDLGPASVAAVSRRSIAEIPTAVLTASVRPEMDAEERRAARPWLRPASWVALGAALAAVVAVVAWRRAEPVRAPSTGAGAVAVARDDARPPAAARTLAARPGATAPRASRLPRPARSPPAPRPPPPPARGARRPEAPYPRARAASAGSIRQGHRAAAARFLGGRAGAPWTSSRPCRPLLASSRCRGGGCSRSSSSPAPGWGARSSSTTRSPASPGGPGAGACHAGHRRSGGWRGERRYPHGQRHRAHGEHGHEQHRRRGGTTTSSTGAAGGATTSSTGAAGGATTTSSTGGGTACDASADCTAANATSACSTGNCVVVSCTSHYADCDMMPGDGCEADLQTDDANCGSCGHACAAGTSCKEGKCK